MILKVHGKNMNIPVSPLFLVSYFSNLLKYCRFTKDGVLVEGLFWKDVEALIDDYAAEPKKKK